MLRKFPKYLRTGFVMGGTPRNALLVLAMRNVMESGMTSVANSNPPSDGILPARPARRRQPTALLVGPGCPEQHALIMQQQLDLSG